MKPKWHKPTIYLIHVQSGFRDTPLLFARAAMFSVEDVSDWICKMSHCTPSEAIRTVWDESWLAWRVDMPSTTPYHDWGPNGEPQTWHPNGGERKFFITCLTPYFRKAEPS